MKYIWEEVGWYDCCGGGWMVVYNLIQSGNTIHEDIPLQVYEEEDIYFLTFMFERLTRGGEYIHNYHLKDNDLYYDVWAMVGEMVYEFGVEVVKELLHSDIVIIRDEIIDWEDSWTCTDDY